MDMVDVTGIRIGTIAAENAPSRGIISSCTIGRIVFSIHTVEHFDPNTAENFFNKEAHGANAFYKDVYKNRPQVNGGRNYGGPGCGYQGRGRGRAAVEDTKGGVDFKEAKVEAEVVTIIKGTTNKGINKETIIKETIKNKATIMTTVTTIIKVGVTTQDLPRDKVKVREETTILPKVETKRSRAIILIALNKLIQVLMASALLDTWEPHKGNSVRN